MTAKKMEGPNFKDLTNTVGGITTGELQPDELCGIEEHLRAVYAMGMKHGASLPKGRVEAEIFKITSGATGNYDDPDGDDEDDEGEESE